MTATPPNLPAPRTPVEQRLSGLSISAKGFCLAVILGIMELSFVAALGWQLHQADLRAVRQTEVKDIYLHSQDLVRSVYVGHEYLCAYILQRNKRACAEYFKFVDSIKNDLSYLDAQWYQIQRMANYTCASPRRQKIGCDMVPSRLKT